MQILSSKPLIKILNIFRQSRAESHLTESLLLWLSIISNYSEYSQLCTHLGGERALPKSRYTLSLLTGKFSSTDKVLYGGKKPQHPNSFIILLSIGYLLKKKVNYLPQTFPIQEFKVSFPKRKKRTRGTLCIGAVFALSQLFWTQTVLQMFSSVTTNCSDVASAISPYVAETT